MTSTLRLVLAAALLIAVCGVSGAQVLPDPSQPQVPSFSPQPSSFDLRNLGQDREQVSVGLRLLAMLTVLTLVPSILMMVTGFTRIVVVLGFIRRAIGVQEVPPTPVVLGLALFLTLFVMAPVFTQINEDALQPYLAEEIGGMEAIDAAEGPLREFMLEHTRRKDLALFVRLARLNPLPSSPDEVPIHVLIPAFMISELKTAFTIGFMIYIPFLVIDMVVASILLSMGMMMLPPVLISVPFKVILFVLVDGWNLLIGSLVAGFA